MVWSGSAEGQTSFFDGLLNSYDQADIDSESLRRDIERGAQAANGAMDEMLERIGSLRFNPG